MKNKFPSAVSKKVRYITFMKDRNRKFKILVSVENMVERFITSLILIDLIYFQQDLM